MPVSFPDPHVLMSHREILPPQRPICVPPTPSLPYPHRAHPALPPSPTPPTSSSHPTIISEHPAIVPRPQPPQPPRTPDPIAPRPPEEKPIEQIYAGALAPVMLAIEPQTQPRVARTLRRRIREEEIHVAGEGKVRGVSDGIGVCQAVPRTVPLAFARPTQPRLPQRRRDGRQRETLPVRIDLVRQVLRILIRGPHRGRARPQVRIQGILRRERGRWPALRRELPGPNVPRDLTPLLRFFREEISQVHIELGPRTLRAEEALIVLRLDVAWDLGVGLGGGHAGVFGFGGSEEGSSGAEAGGGEAHLDGGFAHALEGVAAGFGGGAFVDEVAEDGGGGEDGEVHVVERLEVRGVSTKIGLREQRSDCVQVGSSRLRNAIWHTRTRCLDECQLVPAEIRSAPTSHEQMMRGEKGVVDKVHPVQLPIQLQNLLSRLGNLQEYLIIVFVVIRID